MKAFSVPMFLCLAVALVADSDLFGEPVKKKEVDYQNYAFKQWYGTTLVWRYERLPKHGAVPKDRMPYAGAIYPDQKGGTASVLAKYDRAFHRNEFKSTRFERRDVVVRGNRPWAGHCNGWTAAAIRHVEPQRSVTRNGVVFTPADIKGLLAELYVYSDTEFLGGIDRAINPGTLHVVIANWLGIGQHPIGVETTLGEEVWNYPAYSFNSTSTFRNNRRVEVRMRLSCVDFLPSEVNKAPKTKKNIDFHYLLALNEDGEIVDGTYFNDSSQIDMLWVPMKPSKGGTEGNEDGNPHIDPDTILDIWRASVPESVRNSWYVVDPWPEDAVIVSDWFNVSPTPDDARLEYVPGFTRQRAATLASAADRVGSRAADETLTTDRAEINAPNSASPKNSNNKVEDAQKQSSNDLVVEIFRERFPDGSLRVERNVTLDADFNYVNHGMYRHWNASGELIAEGHFDLGRRVDQWKRVFERDEAKLFARMPFRLFREPFISTANFRDGRLNGKWTIEDGEGRIVSEIGFLDGARHGRMTRFYPDGSKMREVDLQNGFLDGLFREFNERGELVVERKYIDGHFVSVEVEEFVSTTKKAETSLLSPRMTIESSDDWWNAELSKYGVEDGEPVRHGPQAAWHGP